jgi:hypothetical protein
MLGGYLQRFTVRKKLLVKTNKICAFCKIKNLIL